MVDELVEGCLVRAYKAGGLLGAVPQGIAKGDLDLIAYAVAGLLREAQTVGLAHLGHPAAKFAEVPLRMWECIDDGDDNRQPYPILRIAELCISEVLTSAIEAETVDEDVLRGFAAFGAALREEAVDAINSLMEKAEATYGEDLPRIAEMNGRLAAVAA